MKFNLIELKAYNGAMKTPTIRPENYEEAFDTSPMRLN